MAEKGEKKEKKGKGKRKAAEGEKKEKKTKKAKKGTGLYKVINKKRYDRGMIEAAEQAVKTDDGKIGLEDAKKILKEALDGHTYTTVEKNTMKYIRDEFKFTDEADDHIRKAVASFAAKKAAKTKKKGAAKKGKGKGKGKKKKDDGENDGEKAEAEGEADVLK